MNPFYRLYFSLAVDYQLVQLWHGKLQQHFTILANRMVVSEGSYRVYFSCN